MEMGRGRAALGKVPRAISTLRLIKLMQRRSAAVMKPREWLSDLLSADNLVKMECSQRCAGPREAGLAAPMQIATRMRYRKKGREKRQNCTYLSLLGSDVCPCQRENGEEERTGSLVNSPP